jgi:hypothetical protein
LARTTESNRAAASHITVVLSGTTHTLALFQFDIATLEEQLDTNNLRQYRRQYLQWITARPPDASNEADLAQSFVTYLENAAASTAAVATS